MELKNDGKIDMFANLREIFNKDHKKYEEFKEQSDNLNNLITEKQKIEIQKRKTYKQRVELYHQLNEIKMTTPSKLFTLLMELQIKIDDCDTEGASQLIFNVDDDNNIMNLITDLIFVSNHSEVTPAKRVFKTKLTKAEIYAKAQDPNEPSYMCCPKCSRPVRKSYLQTHQQNAICVEIKAGRAKTLEGQNRHAPMGRFIAEKLCVDDVSDDEEDKE
jgi:hypothetical protein